MTDEEIRDVFVELQRIGVDLAKPPGLAVGTGFGDGEFLSWLRTLPEGLGHEEFVGRVHEHVSSAQPNVDVIVPGAEPARPHRQWPTVEQMHAGIDILVREWDPLGARLGQLAPEDVMQQAYNALRAALSGDTPGAIERRIAGMLGVFEREVFGVRPSPREQRAYLARRLIRVIADNPGPRHEDDPWEELRRTTEASRQAAIAAGMVVAKGTSRRRVALGPRGDEPPALDPKAACTECGAIGTVAVVVREAEPLVSRYCPECWSAVRDKYWETFRRTRSISPDEARTAEELIGVFERLRARTLFHTRERPRYVSSALWEDQLPFIVAALDDGDDKLDRERHLQRLAREIAGQASRMYGPMPPEIATFVQRYGPADA
jgi:hypothetical protein